MWGLLASSACRRDRTPAPPDDAAQPANGALVETIAAKTGAGPRVLAAIAKTPRHFFVPGVSSSVADEDRPLPTDEGQVTSQPSLIATMTAALELEGHEKVLEIGTGSGYQTAILARLSGEVFSIEILPGLAAAARARLEALGIGNVRIRVGDGYEGWPEAGPFDRVLITAAVEEVPPALLAQLRETGIVVAPVGPSGTAPVQRLTRIRVGPAFTEEDLGPVRFTPLVRVRAK
jgi:protein-L-isoaspartate(D-aspartate) O-methyltransferase